MFDTHILGAQNEPKWDPKKERAMKCDWGAQKCARKDLALIVIFFGLPYLGEHAAENR